MLSFKEWLKERQEFKYKVWQHDNDDHSRENYFAKGSFVLKVTYRECV